MRNTEVYIFLINPLILINIYTFYLVLFLHKLGRKKTIQLGNAVAYGTVDNSLPDGLNQFNLDELPLFKLAILTTATDNFSEANKLGRGGFGPVYKVASCKISPHSVSSL